MCSCLFFNDTATTEIYTLSLRDALPILLVIAFLDQRKATDATVAKTTPRPELPPNPTVGAVRFMVPADKVQAPGTALKLPRSEEHTSELQSRQYLVCRLLLEKK